MGAPSEIDADLDRLGIGGNNPPEPTPFDGFKIHIDDLFGEAKNFLDGAGIQSEEEATGVATLLSELRKASKDADAARSAEKKPHDDAAKAVQVKWKPLLDRADLAMDTAKKALAPWLEKKEAEQRAAAEAARREAEEKAKAAAEAARQADVNDLAAREDASAKLKEAEEAQKAANRADKARPHAVGGSRAITLRSHFTPVLMDPATALDHYRQTRPSELRAALLAMAETDVANGARAIPGFEITEERRAV